MTFKFDVPKVTGSSDKRHPQYISPATDAMRVDIYQSTCTTQGCDEVTGYPKIVGLTPTSTGCSSTLASTNCTLSLALPAGSYVANFVTLDATGISLSVALAVPFTVTAGATNTVSMTLSGIPVALSATPLSPGSASFAVGAVDADSNLIVGVGAPTVSVTANSGIAVNLTQPTTSSPNVFTATASSLGTAAITVSASYPSGATNACAITGAVCSSAFKLTSSQTMLVSNESGTLTEFSIPNLAQLGTTLSPQGVNGAYGLAFDGSGNLFVGNVNGNSVTEYAPPYTGAPLATITANLQSPAGLAVDASGNLFVAQYNGNVLEYQPPYTGDANLSLSLGTVRQIALDSSGDLFAADVSTAAGVVHEMAPPYAFGTQTNITNQVSALVGIAMNSANDLYILNSSTGSGPIELEVAPPYTGSEIGFINHGIAVPQRMIVDALNNVYIYDTTDESILQYPQPQNVGAGAATFNAASFTNGSIYGMAIVPNQYSLAIAPQ